MPRLSAFATALICLGLTLTVSAQAHAYSVQAGDTPQSIAKKHNISVDELLKANKNLKPSKMLIGDTVVIPGSAPAKSDSKHQDKKSSDKKSPEKEPAKDSKKDNASSKSDKSDKSEHMSAKERAAEARDREKEQKAQSSKAAASSYTVKKGDTLGSIASKHGVSTADLQKANKGLTANKLQIGQELALPGGAPAKAEPAPKAEPAEKPSTKAQKTAPEPQERTTTHTVRKHETADSVARHYHISVKELGRLNPGMGKKIHTGQKLVVPVGSVGPGKTGVETPAPEAEPEAAPERPSAKAPRTPEPAEATPSLPESRDTVEADAAFEKGIEFGKQNKFQKAVEYFDKAVKLNPGRADYYASRGHAHYYLTQYAKAIDDYTKAIEKNPSLALAYSMRGLSRARSDKYQQAIEDFNKAISLGPGEADYYKGRGFTYLRLKQYGPMCQDYQKACSLGDCELLESVKKEKLCQ